MALFAHRNSPTQTIPTCSVFHLDSPSKASPSQRQELAVPNAFALDLKRFSIEMKEDDLVVLRLGTDKVQAVGEVVGAYDWSEAFGDVDGWNLQHVRRVRWLWPDLVNPKNFGTYGLKLGDTTQRLNVGPVTRPL